MSPFLAMLRRDLRISARTGGSILTVALFFTLVGALMPFAVGPDRALLARLGPGIVWIAALLALLIAIDRLFRADHEDGTLAALRLAPISLEAIVFAKLIAHWLLTALPLIVITPLLAVLFGLDGDATLRLLLTLLIGTPSLTAFAAIGGALTVSIGRGGLLAPVLILPLCVPTLIFGVAAATPGLPGSDGAALLYLAAFTLLALVIAPFAAALALKMAAD
ncbi:MAG: heme exporter protein CcmB [Cucumibacter sp.]